MFKKDTTNHIGLDWIIDSKDNSFSIRNVPVEWLEDGFTFKLFQNKEEVFDLSDNIISRIEENEIVFNVFADDGVVKGVYNYTVEGNSIEQDKKATFSGKITVV